MGLTVIAIFVIVLAVVGALWWRRREKGRLLLAAHSIDAEELHRVLAMAGAPQVFDVRQPLDLLAYSEMIPGAQRIAPKEIMSNLGLIPQDDETVVYCTCPGNTTAHAVLNKALGMKFFKVRILTGGLDAWKAKGYPVVKYETAFRLDTPV